MSDGTNDVEAANATVMSGVSAEGSAAAAGQSAQTASRGEAGLAPPVESNGTDQKHQPQNQPMMPPPKRLPPPMFKPPVLASAKPATDSADAAGKLLVSPVYQLVTNARICLCMWKATGALLARVARAKARTAAVAAAAAAAKSSLPAQRERAVAEAAARVRYPWFLDV